jgi:hypothetical protein
MTTSLEIVNLNLVKEILTYFQLVTAIFATIYFKKYNEGFIKYFLVFLWYTVINDFFGKYYSIYINNNNKIFYNIYQIVQFGFYLTLFYFNIKNKTNKNVILLFLSLYFVSILINCSYENFITSYFQTTYIIGAAFTVIAIIMYFSEILNSDKIIIINKILLFWISTAILIYYLPSIPFMVVQKYYIKSLTLPYINIAKYFLVFVLNVLFISGFIWSKKD